MSGTEYMSAERHRDSFAALGYLEQTLRSIAAGNTIGKTPAEYARDHLEKAAKFYPAANIKTVEEVQ